MNVLLPNGRVRLLASPSTLLRTGLWLILLLISVGVVFFFFAASPVNASIVNIFGPSPTATQENLWAYADVPKPTATQTPASVILPADTVIPPADTMMPPITEIPGSIVMEIVEDTPVPTHAVEEPASVSIPSYGGSKYILVDISDQHMYVYEGDALIYSFVASTGMNNATRVGTFAVQSKIPNAYGSTWNIWMPNWLGIYWSGGLENGIHALPILPNGATLWAGFLGRPVSYGCVVLGTYDSQLLYDWAEIGTTVEIQW